MDKKKKADSKRIGQSIKIKKYDDIFEGANDGSTQKNGETVFVSIYELADFKEHPFKVEGKGIEELIESIREHGILSPIIVRSLKDGGYEIISGHRRKYCAGVLGLTEVPVIIRDIDDDEAILAMVDSNIQREDILPSEKAFAYKMKLEAIKRQGERRDLDKSTSGQVVRKLESADIIGNENNESGRQIRRYIRLTELPETLLNAVDSKRISFNAGVELSYLEDEDKKAVEAAIKETRRYPSLQQARKLRQMSGFTDNDAALVLIERTNKRNEINLNRTEIRAFFPEGYTADRIEEEIIEILTERIAGLNNKT